MSKWNWIVLQLTRKLWFRSSLFAILAVITALVSIALKPFIPLSVTGVTGTDAVDQILKILASSMLAVTTFSLNVMVSAYNAASSNVTPRATRLLVEDTTTQNVLATFIGSFLYSLVGIVALSMGAYGRQGRVILFFVTLIVIVLIVLTLLRWIQHLAQFGQMGETTQRIENVTLKALTERLNNPLLGANEWKAEQLSAAQAKALYLNEVGYVQHIDMQALADFAERHKLTIFIVQQPGSFVYPNEPALWLKSAAPEIDIEPVIAAFTVRPQRSFDQDPRFGFCVLSEVASRALSPAVNDPGTAIDVIGRSVRLLSIWNDEAGRAGTGRFPRLYMKALKPEDFFDDLFTGIARDGAGLIEVQICLQKALKALATTNPQAFSLPAQHHSLQAFARAEKALLTEHDRQRLKKFIG